MISDIYALSPLQAGMLFHRLFAPDSTAYSDLFSCRLTGDVDPDRLQRAWQALVDRHPVLRTSFHWEGLEHPVQVVHGAAVLPWESLDWRDLAPDAQARRWQEHLAADRARGFDPTVAPLMRVTLARVSDSAYYCCWSHHHLLLDGWCLTLVLSELFAWYDALRAGRVPVLAPVRPYSEYISWLQRRDHASTERYWHHTLGDFGAATALGAPAGPASSGRAPSYRTVERPLSSELTAALRGLAARHRLTLSTLVQGAWALVLSRHSGTDDVVFGATVSGRPPELPGIEAMLGVFINTVPVRLQVPGDAVAAQWLADVQARHVEREAHATLPLTDIQKLSGVTPGSPLFDTNIIVMNYQLDERLARGAAGLEVSELRILDETDIPLTLQVTPGARTTLEIVYDGVRFDPEPVTRMVGHVEFLLQQFAEGLDRPLSTFELVTPVERAQLLDEFNATAAPLDAHQTAVGLWEARVAARPDAIALECEGVRLTFQALNEWANTLAHGLRLVVPEGGALGRDTLVAIAFKRSERLVAAILAVWKCGAAYVPVDPDYPTDRIRQVLDAAAPLVVLRDEGTIDENLERALAGQIRFTSVSELEQVATEAAPDNPKQTVDGCDLAYVIFTSGSTGQPKGAMVEHLGMLNHLLAKIEDLSLDHESVVVQNASHCFDISVWQCFAGLLAGGRTLVYVDDLVLDLQQFLDRVRTDRVTILEVVPSYLGPLLDRFDEDPRPFEELQFLLVTGETVKPSLVERWFRSVPSVPMVNAYGPTEASDDITHAIMHGPPTTSTVPIGRPVRNFHIYVVDVTDDAQRLCPIGVPGELWVSGPGVGRGYLGDVDRTAAAFLEDPFRPERGVRMYRTGDIGWYTEDGTLLLAGRRDHQVKVRGYRIELGDIEIALTGLDAVRDAVVVDRRDPGTDDVFLAAYVSLRDPAVAPGQILGALAARLPEYMIPATCTVLEQLPLTTNGKIDRQALPVPERGTRPSDQTYASPGTDDERRLADIWSDVLGVERPGIHDNFFAVGGDSILSMQIVSRASRIGLALTPRDVFQHQTIAELATVVRPAQLVNRPSRPRTGSAPLTQAQQQFFEDVTVDRHHYNQSLLLEVPPGFDSQRCERALDAVVGHHEALRLRFAQQQGAWRQSVASSQPGPLLTVHSLDEVPVDERAGVVEAIGGRIQASLDIEHGPLIRAATFDLGADKPGRLLIAAHHLAVDGVSWRVLLDDLATAYAALESETVVTLPPVATPFLDWAAGQTAQPPAPAPPHREGNIVASVEEHRVVFDEQTTRGFLTLASEAYQAGPTEILLAAAGLAYAQWSDAGRVWLDLETHGRDNLEGVDLTRTVGWFTSTLPVSLDLTASVADSKQVVAMVTAQLRKSSESPHPPPNRPSVLLNYHGRVDGQDRSDWRLSEDAHGPDRSLRQQREYEIEINGLVSDGCLRVTFAFSRHLHDREVVEKLGHHFQRHFVEIVEYARRGSAREQLLAGLPDVADAYELSPTQQGLLFHGLVEETKDTYFNQLSCVLRGPLDVGAFQSAWQTVTARHAVLRTSFHWQGLTQPVQVVHAQAEIPWTVADWSGLSADAQDRRWAELGQEDRRRPFDLSSPPLMRCALSRIGDTVYRFRWSQHHLLLDGWSSSIVLRDVLAAYRALVWGERFDVPVPPPFREHVIWLGQQDQQAASLFWHRQLSDFEHPTPLVIGLPEMEGRVESGRFGEAEIVVPAAFSAQIKAASAANHITLHTLFQGVWALLLSRHSHEDDVVFGSIASGRPPTLDGADRMVGVFINTVPVRVNIDAHSSVFDWLRRLQHMSAERDVYSFSSLADVQRQSAVPGGTPLFETILIFENYPVAASLAGASEALSVADVQAFEPNNYPMTFVVTPGDSIGLKIMFDAGRFDRTTIEQTLHHVMTLLAGLIDAPAGRLGDVPHLTQAERDQVELWNRTARPLPPGQTVLSLIEGHARVTPEKTAVVCDGRAVTYGVLDARASQLARVLASSGGFSTEGRREPGVRVLVLLHRSERLPETILAIWKCGAVYIPVDPDYPAERLATIIAGARPALLIAESADLGAERVAQLRQQVPVVLIDDVGDADGLDHGNGVESLRPVPKNLAYVIYTSGSTGTPKGAMVEHAGLLNHVLSMTDDLALDSFSVVAQTASHCFDISMWQLFAALVAGGTTVIYPDAMVHQPAALAGRLEGDRVSVVQFVPSYLAVFVDALEAAPGRAPAFRELTHMVVIGEALKSATAARWFRLYPQIPLMNAYGPTEASDSVAHFDLTQPPGQAMVPIGRPIQNTALYVVDPAMQLCAVGVKGQIAIAGIGVGRGYLFDDIRTQAVFRSDPFGPDHGRLYLTGDIGCYRPDGALLFFGRRDHQVKVRGFRIELGEIEACLASIEGVKDAAVVTRARGDDSILCAYVAPRAGWALDEEALARRLAERLPRHAIPDVLRVLSELPVMSNGKIDRRSLEARSIASSGPTASDEPHTATERLVLQVWSEVLQHEEIGLDQSLFDLGGHSLTAIQIVSRINRDCGVAIGITDVFEQDTVRLLARLVASASSAAQVTLVPTPIQPDYDTSPTQKRMWLASRTPHGSAAYNMAGAFWLEGDVDVSALRRAVRALVERHEALRTVFVVVDGVLRQQVRSATTVGEVLRQADTVMPTETAQLDTIVAARIAVPFDLARGPLFDAELMPAEDGRHLLLVRLHHIVGDAVSIRIALHEAFGLYRAFRQGGTASPLAPLTIQYRDFVSWQNRLTADGAREHHRRYWREIVTPQMPRTGFAPDAPESVPTEGPGVVAIVDVDEALTARLRAVAARHGTTVFSAIVSSVYALLYRSSQQEDLVIGSTVSRRDHPLLEEQVGCYIDTLVLRGRAAGQDAAADLLERTARVCHSALAHRDYPFETLLEELSVPVPDGVAPIFDVLVDYVPGPASAGLAAPETGLSVSEYPHVHESAHYDTMFLVGESDDGARMSIQVVFSAARYSAETMAVARTRLLIILRWLAADSGETLAEVDLLGPLTRPGRRLQIGLNI